MAIDEEEKRKRRLSARCVAIGEKGERRRNLSSVRTKEEERDCRRGVRKRKKKIVLT